MAGYEAMRGMVAFSPEEDAENTAYETSPAVRGEFLNAIRSERHPMSSAFGRAKDVGVDLATGVVGLGESAVGVGDILTLGGAGRALSGIGYDPKATKQWLAGFYSEPRRQEEQDIDAADGFMDTLAAIGARPGALVGRIVQAAPGTLGAGAIGGAVARRIAATAAAEAKAAGLTGVAAEAHIAGRIAENTGKIITAATGAEGAQAAGSIAEAGRQAGSDWTRYAPAALAGGAGTALIGRASAGIARRLGVGDIETDIAMAGTGSAAGKSATGMARRIPFEMTKEGTLQQGMAKQAAPQPPAMPPAAPPPAEQFNAAGYRDTASTIDGARRGDREALRLLQEMHDTGGLSLGEKARVRELIGGR